MRKGLGLVTVVAFVFLTLGMSVRYTTPFAPSYVPRHDLLEWTFAAGALYLFVTYLVARAARRKTLVRAFFIEVGVFVGALVTWLVYHSRHGAPPQVMGWDDYLPVTPFHEQLAVPAFMALILAPIIVALVLRQEPAPRVLTS